ncbi:Transcription elongation regulator 1-like protein [Nibea albiflora]|uniref:Transcription elongation regulator 1-like protein n=1 Tax=Nibea albiflora TaxID=240163 RepID=A0ACB7F890_NIBAL|nr:Transcription elongation regulator 1-like protein [Nibea albiflora]
MDGWTEVHYGRRRQRNRRQQQTWDWRRERSAEWMDRAPSFPPRREFVPFPNPNPTLTLTPPMDPWTEVRYGGRRRQRPREERRDWGYGSFTWGGRMDLRTSVKTSELQLEVQGDVQDVTGADGVDSHNGLRSRLPDKSWRSSAGDTWITQDEMGGFQGTDKPLLFTSQIIQRPRRHTPQIRLLLSPQFSGRSRRDASKMQYIEPEDLSSSSSPSSLTSSSLLHLLSLSQFQCVGVPTGDEDKQKNKHPVASTPVPGSPWCVVWTGDDRVFFFNPTIHLSVWERPGDLIGRDISSIIEDPPHKRKRTTNSETSPSCKSPGHDDGDVDGDHEHDSKRNRMEEPMSLVPCPGEVKLLPLNIRVAHFREMMLERGVSAFSTWEKELHKMVFDPRYLLLTSDQRKQEFDQFVKSRLKDEYKEKKSKLQKAREEFKQLLEEAKITSRSTFKEFCICYRGDQRFNALNRKKEQEVLFHHYITSLKKRDKENRARLRKMR